MSEIKLSVEGIDLVALLGENNAKIKILQSSYPNVKINTRGTQIKITGEKSEAQEVKSRIEAMMKIIKDNDRLPRQIVEEIVQGGDPYQTHISESVNRTAIVFGKDGSPIKAKTHNQKRLVEMSRENDIVFAIGPAGTGKTYTAVALAVAALKNKIVKKIILTRPAVEAGESLGFLPGDLKEKVDPYLRPLYDALDDMFPADKLKFFMENRVIEVAPLAFMRGRTLDNAFIILDEAQNCTSPQLKMFLTRLGPSAKCIITGDPSQIDLPPSQTSGLFRALDLLHDVQGIAKVYLTEEDVVRHRLVKEIIKRYRESDEILHQQYEERKAERERRRAEEREGRFDGKAD